MFPPTDDHVFTKTQEQARQMANLCDRFKDLNAEVEALAAQIEAGKDAISSIPIASEPPTASIQQTLTAVREIESVNSPQWVVDQAEETRRQPFFSQTPRMPNKKDTHKELVLDVKLCIIPTKKKDKSNNPGGSPHERKNHPICNVEKRGEGSEGGLSRALTRTSNQPSVTRNASAVSFVSENAIPGTIIPPIHHAPTYSTRALRIKPRSRTGLVEIFEELPIHQHLSPFKREMGRVELPWESQAASLLADESPVSRPMERKVKNRRQNCMAMSTSNCGHEHGPEGTQCLSWIPEPQVCDPVCNSQAGFQNPFALCNPKGLASYSNLNGHATTTASVHRLVDVRNGRPMEVRERIGSEVGVVPEVLGRDVNGRLLMRKGSIAAGLRNWW